MLSHPPHPSSHRLRHDEHSIKSVKDKIALFSTNSNGGGGGSGNGRGMLHQSTEEVNKLGVACQSMTRAYTHSDVRYEQQGSSRSVGSRSSLTGSTSASCRPSATFEQRRSNVKSVSSADLTSHRRGSASASSSSVSSRMSHMTGGGAGGGGGGRSQSLMEIGRGGAGHQTFPKKRSSVGMPGGAHDASEARQISLPPSTSSEQRLSLTTPPWKSGQSKYSPAFKRKPFAVYSTGNVKPPNRQPSGDSPSGAPAAAQAAAQPAPRRPRPANGLGAVAAGGHHHDDSDTDSAVSSGRSSISHCSVSPPPSAGATATAASSSGAENPRVLKKNSVEAINRRNVINSCKSSCGGGVTEISDPQPPQPASRSSSVTSLNKPASRSSSFTIAERKKSLESRLQSTSPTGGSSADSRRGSSATVIAAPIDSSRRSNSRDAVYDAAPSSSASNSRRSSRDTIGEVEETELSRRSEADGGSRVTTPTRSSDNSSDHSRSCSVTPTATDGKKIVSRNNSITSDRSTYSNRSAAVDKYPRSNSIVSKDSGVSEETSSTCSKWSTLEKKYSSGNSNSVGGDTRNKIAKFNTGDSCSERPRDLSLTPVGKTSRTATGSSGTAITPKTPSSTASGSSSIRELTERFEFKSNSCSAASSRRESVVSNASSLLDSSASSVVTPTNNPSFRIGEKTGYVTSSWIEESASKAGVGLFLPEESTEWESFDPSTPFTTNTATTSSSAGSSAGANLLKPQISLKDRKFSVPVYSESSPTKQDDGSGEGGKSVKMRDKKNANAAPSRPSSLIETSTTGAGSELKVFEIGNLGERQPVILSNSTSRGSSQADLLTDTDTPIKSPLLPVSSSSSIHGGHVLSGKAGVGGAGGGGVASGTGSAGGAGTKPSSASGNDPNRRCVSVNDIRRAFEKAEASLSSSLKAASTR